jgi:hypothetical protein
MWFIKIEVGGGTTFSVMVKFRGGQLSFVFDHLDLSGCTYIFFGSNFTA